MFFKKSLPLFICFLLGILTTIQYFVPHPVSQAFYHLTLSWLQGIIALSIIMGLASLIMRHWGQIRRGRNTIYSATTLISLALMMTLGLFFSRGKGSLFQVLYENIFVPLDATMFSLLSFYMASAAYRAFRARTMEATLLLIAAFILIFGMTPFANYIKGFPEFTNWILNVPNLAQKRGILIGVGLGATATALKIIFGIERNWLGGS